MHPPTFVACLLLPAATLLAEPVRILSIGDSLTEEYEFEFPFSAPAVGQPGNHARNWPELLAAARGEHASFGAYKGDFIGYSDLRNAGYQLNFGVPSLTAETWVDVIETTSEFSNLLFYRTREELIDNLPLADVAVIFLGGNDLENVYPAVYNETEAENFFPGLRRDLETLHDFVRTRQPDLPIVVATVPDVGATPERTESGSFDDPDKLAAARARIAAFNESLITEFESRADTAVARVDRLTNLVFDLDPFHLNGTIFTIPGADDNPPDRLFTKDDFHPNTGAQALVANEMLAAINSLLADDRAIPEFDHREILGDLLGLDPDQPYLDWIGNFAVADAAMSADPDGDGLENLLEMLLGSSPADPNPAFTGAWRPGDAIAFSVDEEDARFIDWTAEESSDLSTWTAVPEARVTPTGSATEIAPSDASEGFFRLRARPAR